ncbi:MAG TPA: hypothetical protein VFB82_12550, partial [Blastocatellia bacterium]|nr:hypothetical protein [Blastocatellia bacterium]
MDYYHNRFPVYDDVSSAGNHFHAFGKIPGDTPALQVNGSHTGNPHSGATAIRYALLNTVVSDFAGFYSLNGVLPPGETKPQLNFGTVPNAGLDLSGATALTFWARGEQGGEKVDFFMGGVGRNADTGVAEMPFPDSTPVVKIFPTLTTQWTQYTIDLTGKDLTYVLGGFGWVASVRNNPTRSNPNGVVFFVDDIQYVLNSSARDQRLNQPHLLRSFTTLSLQPDPFDANQDDDIDFVLRNTAFIYDNALALLAFLADGSADGLRRATLIGRAFVYAAQHDRTFNDNRACNNNTAFDPLVVDGARLRTAYAAGDISLPPGWTPNGRTGTVPSPGFYQESTQTFFEVEQSSIDVGNNAWAIIALLGLYRRTQDSTFLDTACKLGNFIHAMRNDAGQYKGFQGGVNDPEASPSRRPWASVEHNLDVFAAFTVMFQITGDAKWQADSQHAQQFIEDMFDVSRGCYLAGTVDPSTRNSMPNQLPLDVQSWNVLARRDSLALHPQLFDCAENNHRNLHDGFSGFDFNEDKDGVWFEGTAQMATAYAVANRVSQAESLRQELINAQMAAFSDGQGMAAASHDGVSSGFGFKLFRRLHVGATAWNVFAQLAFNPYYQTSAGTLAAFYSKGDFDADGKTELGFYRAGLWGFLKSSSSFSTGSAQFFSWGGSGLQPIIADFDGDSKADLAYMVPPGGGQSAAYAILRSTTGYGFGPGQPLFISAGFPSLGDTPVVGDFDADGKADPGIWRASQGVWIIPKSGSNYTSYVFSQWGQLGDIPVVCDLDGDGKADLGFYRDG